MKLGYGYSYIEFDPKGEYRVVLPDELPSAGENEIERSLNEPIGRELSDFAGCKSASILVSDITRPSPSHKMLPFLVKKLKNIAVENINVVFALGIHRRMTVDEEKVLLKNCISLPHTQHDKSRCVSMGSTSRGTPVEIFEEVASSDLIIATGNIEYHYYAGYSGGAKAVLPGVSSERSIKINHELMRQPGSITGRLDSPVRQDMEDAAKRAGLDFILNVVLNSKKEIVKAVCGDYIQAHRVGAAAVDQMYRKSVEPAEIVITSAGGMPKDINLFQAHKALDNAKKAAIVGGTIILLAECSEGLGDPIFERWATEAKCAEDCVERFRKEFEFGGHKAAILAKESLNYNIILVSSLPKNLVEMCFFEHASSLNMAVEKAINLHGNDARMIIMPHGNLTLAV